MFKAIESNSFTTRVTVHMLDEQGRAVTGSFGVEFERATQDELDAMREETWTDSEVFDSKVKRVFDIAGADGNPMPEDQARDYCRRTPECISATVRRYIELMSGDTGKGRTSRKQRATG